MKWILASASILMSQAVQAKTPAPVAHWKFDGISNGRFILDATENGHDLVAASGKASMSLVEGAVGKALGPTNGGSHLMVLESAGKFNFDSGTIEAVVRYLPSSNTQLIFCNTTFSPGVAEGWDFNILPGGYLSFNTGRTMNETWNILKSNIAFESGVVYHVAATWNDNGLMKIYVDGALVASKSYSEYQPSLDICRLGYHMGDSKIGSWLYSHVDEVKLYDRALTKTAIQARYSDLKPALDKFNEENPANLGSASRSLPANTALTLEPVSGGMRLSLPGTALSSAVISDLRGRTLMRLTPQSPGGDLMLPPGFQLTGRVQVQAVTEGGRSLSSQVDLPR